MKPALILPPFLAALLSMAGWGSEKTGEQLARLHCASCHQFPEPELLPKRSWTFLLMHMGLRLGVQDFEALKGSSEQEMKTFFNRKNLLARQQKIPKQALVDEGEWAAIKKYILGAAPVDAPARDQAIKIEYGFKLFKPRAVPYQRKVSVTSMVHIDEEHQQILIGDGGYERLITLDRKLELKSDLVTKSSLWVRAETSGEEIYLLSIGDLMGRFGEERKGRLFHGLWEDDKYQPRGVALPGMHRPADFDFGDFDGDGSDDLLVCNFGATSGSVDIHHQRPDDRSFEQKPAVTVWAEQGAVDCKAHDFDGDGKTDVAALFGNARENLSIFLNRGEGRFERKVIVDQHPAFGYTAFKWVDFDSDGDLDVLTANGDSVDADPYNTLRPYHGIRIYLNDGKLGFTEDRFFPIYGAYNFEVEDFDLDGDLDIAVVAFNPDFGRRPVESFVFLENQGDGDYKAKAIEFPDVDRWMTIDSGDYDGDGDKDLILGGAYMSAAVEVDHPELFERMLEKGRSALVLENLSK